MDVFHTPYLVFSRAGARLLREDCVKPLRYTTALQGCQGFLSVAWKRLQVMKQLHSYSIWSPGSAVMPAWLPLHSVSSAKPMTGSPILPLGMGFV